MMEPVIANQNETFIVVGVENRFMVWAGGKLTGDTTLIRKAKKLAQDRTVVELPGSGKWVRACFSDPKNCAGAIAAMMGVNLRQARLVHVDQDSWSSFNEKLQAHLLSV